MPNEHNSEALFGLVLQPSNDQAHSDQDSNYQSPDGPGLNEDNSIHDDECIDCADCQCCAHFAMTRLDIATRFQPAFISFSGYAPTKPVSNYTPLLRPPRV